uniref:Uncharacterized protein n=1 Tax=Romanomermis culicivorax TaxID=13658 RepID=A0A915I2B0_ROMCU
MDSSIRKRGSINISSSMSFRNSLICMAMAVKLAVTVGSGSADMLVEGRNLAMFKSKSGVSRNSSTPGSETCIKMGWLKSSSATAGSMWKSWSKIVRLRVKQLQMYVPGLLLKGGSHSRMQFIQSMRRDGGLPSGWYHMHW